MTKIHSPNRPQEFPSATTTPKNQKLIFNTSIFNVSTQRCPEMQLHRQLLESHGVTREKNRNSAWCALGKPQHVDKKEEFQFLHNIIKHREMKLCFSIHIRILHKDFQLFPTSSEGQKTPNLALCGAQLFPEQAGRIKSNSSHRERFQLLAFF